MAVEMLIQQSHSGPLPSAREFRGYNDVLPGAAERILAMAELEQRHRHELESTAVKGEVRIKGRGQWFALAALVLSLLLVGLFARWGYATAGAGFGTAIIVGLVALFLGQKWIPSKETRDPPSSERERS